MTAWRVTFRRDRWTLRSETLICVAPDGNLQEVLAVLRDAYSPSVQVVTMETLGDALVAE